MWNLVGLLVMIGVLLMARWALRIHDMTWSGPVGGAEARDTNRHGVGPAA